MIEDMLKRDSFLYLTWLVDLVDESRHESQIFSFDQQIERNRIENVIELIF